MLWGVLILSFGFQIFTTREVVAEVSKYSVDEYILDNGYPLEEHTDIETEDGYLLQMQRIPHGMHNDTKITGRPPVLLMHGMGGSAENWVATGPGKGLAFILADLGYDVWLGNARGSIHSRNHVRMDANLDSDYWLFSYHEIGVYDLPAKIDLILNETGQDKIYYVGHSQGTTAFFVLTSTRPEYNNRIRLMSALAPVVYSTHVKGSLARVVALTGDRINSLANALGLNEVLPLTPLTNMASEVLCSEQSILQEVCINSLFLVSGFDSAEINRTLFTAFIRPSSISANQVAHFSQGSNSGKFRQFDYGSMGNLRKYNSMYPPRYQLEKVTVPVALYYGKNDFLVSPEDVEKLEKELPNVVESYLIPYENFNHIDFLWANDVVDMLYDRVISLMSEY